MKRQAKVIAIILAAIMMAMAIFWAILTFTYEAGRYNGIKYALDNVEIYTVECYNPENPYENARPDGTDQTVYLTVDGTTYEKGMYQG